MLQRARGGTRDVGRARGRGRSVAPVHQPAVAADDRDVAPVREAAVALSAREARAAEALLLKAIGEVLGRGNMYKGIGDIYKGNIYKGKDIIGAETTEMDPEAHGFGGNLANDWE